MQRFLSLYREVPKEGRRKAAEAHDRADKINAGLSVTFVLGLILSLLGKLGGADTEAPET